MPRFSVTQASFGGGELSPSMGGRVDLTKYASGAERIQNFLIQEEGGLLRRSGFRFVSESMDSAVRGELVPFVFSTEQAYILEFGEQRFRVYADEGVVLAPTLTVTFAQLNLDSNEVMVDGHGFPHLFGPIQFGGAGTLPAGLSMGVDYWVVRAQDQTITSVANGTETLTSVAHGMTTGMGPFWLQAAPEPAGTAASLPTGLLPGKDYWVIRTGADTFQLAATKADAIALTEVTFTTDGTGDPLLLARNRPNPLATGAAPADGKLTSFRLSTDPSGVPLVVFGAGGSGSYTLGPTSPVPLEVEFPLTAAEIQEIQYVQSADVLYIVHADHPPLQVSRTSNTSWEVDDVDFIDGPYLSINKSETLLSSVAVSITEDALGRRDVVDVVGSLAHINGGAGFTTDDIGRAIRVENATDYGAGLISGVVSAIQIEVWWRDKSNAVVTGNSIRLWRLGAFYPGNYPVAISFFEQRLALGGEAATPQTIHASVTGDFTRFSPLETSGTDIDVLDSSAIDYTIGDNQVNSIVFLQAGRNLIVGTPGGIFPVLASTNAESVTPTNINIQKASSAGAAMLRATTFDTRVIYVSRTLRKVYSVTFSFDIDGFLAEDVSLLADHATESGVHELDSVQEPDPTIFLLRSDGTLMGLTFNPEQQLFGWYRIVAGGSFEDGQAVIESIGCIPTPDGTSDSCWILVKRTIDGATVRYVEFLEDNFTEGTDQEDAFFVDSGLSYSGAPIGMTAPLTGLDHLEGETVQVFSDGGVHPDVVVTGGEVTLTDDYSTIHVGLGYESRLRTLRIQRPDVEGSSLGKLGRFDHVVVRLLRSMGGKLGPDDAALDIITYRTPEDPMDTAPPPFTGDIKFSFEGGFEREARVVVVQDQPIPFTLLALSFLGQEQAR